MPNLNLEERLQPSLLDRLQDLNPEAKTESFDRMSMTPKQLRDRVERDLVRLIGTVNAETSEDLENYPQTRSSVTNFGVPQIVGRMSDEIDTGWLGRQLKEAVRRFEPRVELSELQVGVVDKSMSRKALRVRLVGSIWSQPAPLDIDFLTDLEL